MPTPEIRAALSAWRAVERRWRTTPAVDPTYRAACLDVVQAWLSYQVLVDDPASFILVVDDDRRYVAASAGVRAALGYEPAELIGSTTEAIVPTDLVPSAATAWERLLADGEHEGQYRLRGKDQTEVEVRFEARAHHPIPGYHALRSWPVAPVGAAGTRSSAA